MVRSSFLGLRLVEGTQLMYSLMLIGICAVNMVLAVLTGIFLPVEYHGHFALQPRDYFLLSFVGFCLGLYQYRSDHES